MMRVVRKLLERSTGEILVLLIAFTICGGVAVSGISMIVFVFLNPDADPTAATRLIASVVNTLIGLLAGFLAGATTNVTPKKDASDAPPDHE